MGTQSDFGSTDRLLVVSLDGATFDILTPLMNEGVMPSLATLAQRGVVAPLVSSVPPITPVAWTSFMTGKNPGKHGIFDFRLFNPNMYTDAFVNATHVQARTLWQYLSEAGIQVGVLNLPMTYPPYPVNGFIVSGFDTPSLKSQFTYPIALRDELLARFPDYDFIPSWGPDADKSTSHFRAFTEAVKRAFQIRTKAALYLVERFTPDVFMVHYQNLDVLQHKAWGYLDPVLAEKFPPIFRQAAVSCLQELDRCLGCLLEHPHFAGADLLIVSDHGFGPLYGYLYPNVLLEKWGFLVRSTPTGQDPNSFSVRDGLRNSRFLPVRWTYRQLGYLRWRIRSHFMSRLTWLERARTASIERDIPTDWERTKALISMAEIYGFVQVYPNDHPGGRRELVEELKKRFGEVANPQTGERLFSQVLEGRNIFDSNGTLLPDLVLIPAEGWTVLRQLKDGDFLIREKAEHKGTHRMQGIFVAGGPNTRSSDVALDPHIVDIAPTILHLLGLTIPRDMDGRILAGILKTQRHATYTDVEPRERQKEHDLSEGEKESLGNRLRALGYLDQV